MDKLTEEQKDQVLKQDASIKLVAVYNIIRCLDVATSRGAFKGNELSFVGTIYDMLNSGLNNAFTAKLKEVSESKVTDTKEVELDSIPE